MSSITPAASEADVETRFLLPFMTRSQFLGYPLDDIRSKEGISARDIGKGAKRKIGYIPDYCVYKQSLPILVVEAKAPSGDVHQAYAEARLYAAEINRSFPPGLNPCCRVIATDGATLLAGHWDSDPSITTQVDSLRAGTGILDELIALLGNDALETIAGPINSALRATDFK